MANTTGKKFGGRQKGTPNKLTKELRCVLKDVLYEENDRLPERLDELHTKHPISQNEAYFSKYNLSFTDKISSAIAFLDARQN